MGTPAGRGGLGDLVRQRPDSRVARAAISVPCRPHVHEREPTGDRPLVFGYVGTVTPRVPLAQFVAGWQRARELSPIVAASTVRIHGYLGFYALPRSDLMAIVDRAADSGVSYEGPVAKGEIGRVYDS